MLLQIYKTLYNIADIVKSSNSVTGDEPTLKHEGLFIDYYTLFN